MDPLTSILSLIFTIVMTIRLFSNNSNIRSVSSIIMGILSFVIVMLYISHKSQTK